MFLPFAGIDCAVCGCACARVCVLLQEVFSVWDCLALESYVTRQSAVVEVMYLLYSTFIGGTFIEGFSAFCQYKINVKGYHIVSVWQHFNDGSGY